ncbi:2-iminoacetate synthase ThiH [Deferrisoma palaeochoriense]
MTFEAYWSKQPWAELVAQAERAREADVEAALAGRAVDFEGFLALLSPAASRHLEPMARRAQALTAERFGRVVQLYAPLYVSNDCLNACVYCGFNRNNPIRRTTLTPEEAEAEARVLWSQGFRNLLVVSSENPKVVPVGYFEELGRRIGPLFPSLSVEIYPLDETGYGRLVEAGYDGVTVFQETYDPDLYRRVHPSGRKADYGWRLGTPERAARAGMRRVGLGALLGLGPWRLEAVGLALHALWLERHHWKTQVTISFPRLRPAPGGFQPPHPVSDRELVQMMCALRLLLPDVGLVLSTRESPEFRDGVTRICVTHTSAGSRTEPGGYTRPGAADVQFQVEDRRSPREVAARLTQLGLEPVWKDWDAAFRTSGESGRLQGGATT